MSHQRALARHRAVALALLLCPAPGCGDDIAAPEPDDFAVLFVGNSLTYTNGLPHMLQQLFALAGEESPVIGEQAFPDFGLQDHWVTGARERIAQGVWDVVVLQQGPSATEGRPSLLEYSQRFATDIRAAGGEPALYMVWPAASRLFDFAGVSDSYATAADLVDGLLFPAGEAWLAAWRVDPELELYGPDGFHPSLTGTYLAALVIYQQLSGNDPRLLPAVIPGPSGIVEIGTEQAGLLQQAAFEANAAFAR
jgi:hypothetical protein